jgi:hypothetical protein
MVGRCRWWSANGGGFGFNMYGGPAELGSRAERIRAFKRELVNRPFAGDIYTQATSIEDEVNGLLDPHTGELFVPAGLLSSSMVHELDQ